VVDMLAQEIEEALENKKEKSNQKRIIENVKNAALRDFQQENKHITKVLDYLKEKSEIIFGQKLVFQVIEIKDQEELENIKTRIIKNNMIECGMKGTRKDKIAIFFD